MKVFWQMVAGLLASLLAAIHAVMNKRDSRAAALWLGFIWLLPLLGPATLCIHVVRADAADIARLGFRALLGGSLVSFMTAAIAGILMG